MPRPQPNGPIQLYGPRELGARTWGREILLAHTPHYTLKVLQMRAGKAGGLQRHVEKHESFFLSEGSAWVDYDAGDGTLTRYVMHPGMTVVVPPGATHRVTAIEDCVFYEASTPHFNDRVRVEAEYGEPDVGGLPSTHEASADATGTPV